MFSPPCHPIIQSKVRHSTASFLHYFSGCKCMLLHTYTFCGTKNPSTSILSPSISGRIILTETEAQSLEICIITEFSGPCQTTPQIGELWSSFPSRSLGPWLVLLTAHLHICSAAAAWENSRKAYWFFLYASFLLSKDVWKEKVKLTYVSASGDKSAPGLNEQMENTHNLCSFKGLNQIEGKIYLLCMIIIFVC